MMCANEAEPISTGHPTLTGLREKQSFNVTLSQQGNANPQNNSKTAFTYVFFFLKKALRNSIISVHFCPVCI